MDQFIEDLSKSVNDKILGLLSDYLNSFADAVIQLPEMKEKSVTKEQILEEWNKHSDFKVSAMTAPVVTNGTAPPKTRVATDRTRKCSFILTRGINEGKPCEKNCVAGSHLCPDHHRKANSGATPLPGADVSAQVSNGISGAVVAAPATVAPVPQGSKCVHILQSGANKDSPCGKNATKALPDGRTVCTVHSKKYM
jgi:hypothetical protein